ncbi:hypothetical protein BGZ54_003369 [Gamsiella multidivaricata]|nr:hypothetical protein BGZ54_003369 [Gamsiella multidivaricata]
MAFWARLYGLLRPLRILISLLAFANFMIIAGAMRFDTTSDESSKSLMDSQQIIINGCLFMACLYASFGRSSWTSSYRAVLVGILCVLAIIYGVTLLIKIRTHGGCSSGYFMEVSTRCIMQYAISGIELSWTLFLFIDGFVSYHQYRDLDWQNRMRAQEEERAQAAAIRYQPDLSLYGSNSGSGNDNVNDSIAHVGPSAVEMEPLPAYMPRPDKDQLRIVDLTNLSEGQQVPAYYQSPASEPPADHTRDSGSGSGSSPPSPAGPSTAAAAPETTAPTVPALVARLPSYAP